MRTEMGLIASCLILAAVIAWFLAQRYDYQP
jgi:hypothetical protein